LYPSLNPATEDLIRRAYGLLLLATLACALPHAQRYFLSERWGGYGQRGAFVDAIQNPVGATLALVTWMACAVALLAGRYVAFASAINVALCWYFFVRMRWRSLLRGMGAPGYITFWLGAAVCLLTLARALAPAAHDVALWTIQVDFALIMVSAGVYKFAAGYRTGDGMDLGMVNPEWGYWPDRWRRWPPSHKVFRFLNEAAWSTEVVAGVLMLIPATRVVGAALILASFVFIATQIRLGFLCEMVIVCCLLFLPGEPARTALTAAAPSQSALVAVLWAYVIVLPFVRAGLFYNQLAHKALPRLVQAALDGYANLFGLIIWRVFSADIVNFFVRVWERPRDAKTRRLVSDYEGLTGLRRFRQVAEAIVITSVFTTLKYYPSNRALFVERLVRYARTIPHVPGSTLVFEWVGVVKGSERFEFVPATEYFVDVAAATVTDHVIADHLSVSAAVAKSPVHEGARPGSYAPLRHAAAIGDPHSAVRNSH
jgi:hypothetical protein